MTRRQMEDAVIAVALGMVAAFCAGLLICEWIFGVPQ